MEFGTVHGAVGAPPWTAESERQVYANALEQVRLADELGFDYVWAVEHHFLEEYSHCSAPDLFLTACAMQTSPHPGRARGRALRARSTRAPIRVAERAAVLDILSGGRLELGTGRSATWTELGGFRADPDETKKTWDEFVRVIPKMWMQERFSWEGRAFSMPERAVLPKPIQKPHPPMWVAVTSPGTEIDAADRGLGCLGLHAGWPTESEKKVKHLPLTHPELRAGRRIRQRQGAHGQLPLLLRRTATRVAPLRPAGGEHLQLHGLAAAVGQGSAADPLVPFGGPVARRCDGSREARATRPSRSRV